MIHEFDPAIRRYAEEQRSTAPEPAVRRPDAIREAPLAILRVLETTGRHWREPLA